MPNQTPSNGGPNLHALLIGVDCYLPNMLPGGSYYRSLGGCARDISHVEDLLTRKFGLQEERIVKLTATNIHQQEPPEPQKKWPTFANMVAAFEQVTEKAQPGDHVYIHYSGHGGRATTNWPEIKGPNGIDEALVPTDIGNSEARYLRDVELAMLLKNMADKGLVVAVVLDSCHSGGMVRGRGDVAVRGLDTVDTTKPLRESPVGTAQELAALWDELTQGGTRDASLGSGWLPEPEGYTLLAACRPTESAYEYAFEGTERNGALSYWLLDSLNDAGEGLSYKVLHDRIVAKVHSQFERQTPQLQGEGDRAFLGSERVEPHYAVNVLQVDVAKPRVPLNAGQAHGLRRGAQFAIFPHGTIDFADQAKRLAVVEISDLGAVQSWATILQDFGRGDIEQGGQALLLGAGAAKLVRKVALERNEDLDPAVDQDAALQAVEAALEGKSWVEVATNDEEIAYQVTVSGPSEYEIWDRTGVPISNLRPALKVNDAKAASGVARRLTHLSKYHAIQQLNNHDPLSPLARKLVVDLIGKRTEYDPADPFEPERLFGEPGRTPMVAGGEWVGLRIKNDSPRKLNITVFDLQPGWGAKQIYPWGAGDAFVEFEPGQELILPLNMYLPQCYDEGRDILKVFATMETTNFRWMELPSLDEPLRRSDDLRTRTPASPLEELAAVFTADQPSMRDAKPAAYPTREWVTEQVEVHIKKT